MTETCRVCGCTDEDCRGCIERTGRPCHWIEPGLCSACADAELTWEEADVLWGRVGLVHATDPFALFPEQEVLAHVP